MAVSNAFGSNIFDILLGLGLPWMLQTCFADPGSSVFPYATACTDLPCRSLNDCERSAYPSIYHRYPFASADASLLSLRVCPAAVGA